MRSTKLPTLLLTACSLAACGVPRPDTDLCVVNAEAKHRKCYNLSRDYDDDGLLIPGAVPSFRPAVSVDDLNKNICTDPDGWANLKAYIKKLRETMGGR
jgi:hypothetical protein